MGKELRESVEVDGEVIDVEVEDFKMSARFKGRNVIEGLKTMIELGYATPPLPDHLANLVSMASNRIVVGSYGSKGADKEDGEGEANNDAVE